MVELRLPAGPVRSEPVVEDDRDSARAAVRNAQAAGASADECLLARASRGGRAGACAKDQCGDRKLLHVGTRLYAERSTLVTPRRALQRPLDVACHRRRREPT